jgi:hypothetical protein
MSLGEGLQNLGLCSALRASEQGGIFLMPHLLQHGILVFQVSSEGLPHSVTSLLTIHMKMWRIYSNLDPHRDTNIQSSALRGTNIQRSVFLL